MSMYFKPFDRIEDGDAECTYCDRMGGNVITIHINKCIRIHLCEDCLKQFRRDIDEQLAQVSRWCMKCKHFEPSPYGCFKYGGHCKFEPIQCDCHAHDGTCERFAPREA